MPKLPSIGDILDFVTNKEEWEPQEGGGYRRKGTNTYSRTPGEPEVKTYSKNKSEVASVRDVNISRKDFDEIFRPVAFGEISNRGSDKKDLEARVILNTALNRMVEHKGRGTEKTLADILSEPNQYQAFGSDQFKAYSSEDLDEPTKQKKTEIDSILDNLWGELSQGKFEDNTENSVFYIHNDDGTITYDNTRRLFK